MFIEYCHRKKINKHKKLLDLEDFKMKETKKNEMNAAVIVTIACMIVFVAGAVAWMACDKVQDVVGIPNRTYITLYDNEN